MYNNNLTVSINYYKIMTRKEVNTEIKNELKKEIDRLINA